MRNQVVVVSELRLEYVALEDLLGRLDSPNPKEHNVGLLHTSISRFGFASAITINEETGLIVAGEGRLRTLAQMRARGDPPPRYVRVAPAIVGDAEGMIDEDARDVWEIPTLRGLRLSELEGRAFAIADNQSVVGSAFVLAEMWDETGLMAVLQELSDVGLDGTGFDAEDVQAQLDRQAYLSKVELETLTESASVSEVRKPAASVAIGGDTTPEPPRGRKAPRVKGRMVECPYCLQRFPVEMPV